MNFISDDMAARLEQELRKMDRESEALTAAMERMAAGMVMDSLPWWLRWMGLRVRGLRIIYALRLAPRPLMMIRRRS